MRLQTNHRPIKEYETSINLLRLNLQVEHYLATAAAKFGWGQDVRQSTETMEQHSHELDDKNQTEEEDEYQTDRF